MKYEEAVGLSWRQQQQLLVWYLNGFFIKLDSENLLWKVRPSIYVHHFVENRLMRPVLKTKDNNEYCIDSIPYTIIELAKNAYVACGGSG